MVFELALTVLTVIGLTIIIGYIGTLIFDKTRIVDALWLILFGFAIANFDLIDASLFFSIPPTIMASLALIMILFDAGLNIEFYQMLREFPRSTLLAVVSMIATTFSVALIAVVFIGFEPLAALLLGAMVGGTSSPVVISIVNRLSIRKDIKTLLDLESIITDPLVIVVSLALINVMTFTTVSSPLNAILSSFSIGAMVGLVFGIIWLFVLDKLKGKPFDYMLTLAILVLTYVFVETTGGSGAIAALFFGVVLGNGGAFSRMLKFSKQFHSDNVLKSFQSEIAFFVRSFFFVYLGLIVAFKIEYLVVGVLISAVILLIRLAATQISTIGMKMTKYELNIIRTMAPRGLASAILVQFPVIYGIPNAEIFSNIVFIVIISTVLYTTLATRAFSEGKEVKDDANLTKTDKAAEKQLKIREHKRRK